jgi:hypothetical protein
MKSSIQNQLSMVARGNILCLTLLLSAASSGPLARGQNCAFTYQGELTLNGSPANGTYDLKFRLYNDDGSSGHAGAQVGPELTLTGVAVAGGLLSSKLDFGCPAWSACQRRWLEIDVRQGSAAFATLTPRTEVTPTPYAMYAQAACSMAPGAVVTSLNGLKDDVTFSAGPNVTLTPSGNNIQISATGAGPSIWNLNGTSAYYNGGNIGIGTTTPLVQLDILGDQASTRLSSASSVNGSVLTLRNITTSPTYVGAINFENTAGTPGQIGYFADHHMGFRVANAERFTINSAGNIGIGTTTPLVQLDILGDQASSRLSSASSPNGSVLTLRNITASPTYLGAINFENAAGTPGQLGYFADDHMGFRVANAERLTINASGDVGIGTTVPTSKLSIASGGPDLVGTALSSTLVTTAGSLGAGLGSDSALASFGFISDDSISFNNVSLGLRARRTSAGTGWTTTALGLTFDVDNTVQAGAGVWLAASGNVGIGTTQPTAKLDVAEGDIHLNSGHTISSSGRLHIQANEDLYLNPFGGAGTVYVGGGGGPGNFVTAGSASVCSLTIRGGCDLAEPFQISDREIPKGSLVIIDEENEGKLKLAAREYDTRVAGIVSGANGVNSGICLHQEGVFEGGQNVALSGRVYALADASNGAIKPGDLLTSSSVPGHVMKVTDHARAQGAIVGKAMSGLQSGEGMVLVLVSLQ